MSLALQFAGNIKHELFVKNFTCPDFHTCTLIKGTVVDGLKTCEEYIAGLQATCQYVSTHFAETIEKSCGFKGKSICSEPTNTTFLGPVKIMAVVKREFDEKVYNYVTELHEKVSMYAAENFTSLALGGLGTLVLAYGTYRLIQKMNTPPKNI